jgi:pimeloyl-ACP methyl ester carboxylesterase
MWANVNGVRLHYERTGTGEPMLWITGFTISSAVFEPVLPLYEGRFDCVVYDNRSAGRSRGRPGLTSMAALAADAVGLLDRLEIDSAHVHGLSMGGMIAQEVALRFPDRVRGLILGGTTPGGPLAARPTLKELSALRGLPSLLFSPEFRRRHPQRVSELVRPFRAHRPPPHGVVSHWWATVYHDTVSRLGEIQAPTLVMHGGADGMAPIANARMLAARIPDAELAVLPGAGHAFLLEQPEASYARIADWLDRKGEIRPGRPRTGMTARWEPVTRRLGLPIGALRTGTSLARLAGERTQRGRNHVAADR